MIRKLKRVFLRVVFGAEIIAFIGIYIFGAHGMQTLAQRKQELCVIEQEITHLHNEVSHLEKEFIAWNSHPFYKEKIAREQLQMAREGDTIYYLT